MEWNRLMAVGAAAALAGLAGAQPVVDGKRGTGEYPGVLWANRVPTGFGDNHPDNLPPSGDPQNVYTGAELKIPLTAIGSPAGAVKITAFIISGDYGYSANQYVGSLPSLTGNLGEPRNINLNNYANDQFVSASAAPTSAITVDGTADSGYGAALHTQTTFTGFGNATQGLVDFAQGSEIDQIFARKDATDLYITIAGNIECNGNKLVVMIDSIAGGQNKLRGDNTSGALNRMGDDGSNNGLTFDSAFSADYFIAVNGYDTDGTGSSPSTFYVDYAEVLTSGGGLSYYCGSTSAASDGTLSGGDGGAPALKVTVNNSNTAGVTGSPPVVLPSEDDAIGSELDNLSATIDGDRLYVFIGGNLQTSFNKIAVFLDVNANEGQNPMLSSNVDIDFGGLNHMGGLTFDSDFAPDYWMGFTNGNLPVEIYGNAAALLTDGPRTDLNGYPFDYGAYDGGAKSSQNPMNWDGSRLDIQDGSATSIYCNYGPRLAGDSCVADPLNPVGTPGLINMDIDNSNIGGVGGYPDGDTCDASNVSTGFEFSIRLDEAGWDGESPIKILAVVTNGGYDYWSNQLTGELDSGTANFGDPTVIDFSAIPGNQYVKVRCPSDFDGDGFTSGDDFDAFNAAFEAGDPSADFNLDCFTTGDDFDGFVNSFEAGC